MKEFRPDQRTIVALASPADWRDPSTIVIGLSEVAFDAMSDGRTHTVSAVVDGSTVQVVIFRGKTLEDCRAQLSETSTTLGVPTSALPDVGIKTKAGH